MDNKLQSLVKYADTLKQRLEGKIPPKHEGNEEVYRDYLKLELRRTNLTIEELRLKGK